MNQCKQTPCVCCRIKQFVGKVLYGLGQKLIPNESTKEDIPTEPDKPTPQSSVYAGVLQAKSFSNVNATDIKQCMSIDYATKKYKIVVTKPFQTVVVFAPVGKKIYTDDGLGGKTEFYIAAQDEYGNPWYSNGDYTVAVGDTLYYIYGVFTPASGSLFIYIE